MLAYALASKPCSEATNMDSFVPCGLLVLIPPAHLDDYSHSPQYVNNKFAREGSAVSVVFDVQQHVCRYILQQPSGESSNPPTLDSNFKSSHRQKLERP